VRRRDLLGDRDRLVQVLGLDEVVTAERFLGLGERAVGVYPPYAEYQRRTERLIPVFLLSRAGTAGGAG
jgi:hypothetical protein